MVGLAVDLLSNPLGAVRTLFSKACISAGESSALPDVSKGDLGVKALFDNFLYSGGAIAQVPQVADVSSELIAPGSLVRFRGMVQDMLDVEYYVGAYKDKGVWQTNKYTDRPVGEEIDTGAAEIWDRKLFYCVPVPGENQWVKDAWSSSLPSSSSLTEAASRSKRQYEDAATEDMQCDIGAESSKDQNKRMRVDNEHNNDFRTSKTNLIPANSKYSCVVKTYDCCDADLKLNDIAEFVGVVSFDPILTGGPNSDSPSLAEMFVEEDTAFQHAANMAPRLHCITLRKLTTYNIPRLQPLDMPTNLLRESLVTKLQVVLGDDRLAAEYLLLHLMSKVYSRVEPVAIGKLSLNFTGCQPGTEGSLSHVGAAVGHAISTLVPCSHVLPLSLESLNSSSFTPLKDYATNRLVTGHLQLAGGTHLLLDETALNTGQLNATGVKNLQSLKNLLETQKVDYDFQFYQMQMPTDLPVLVVSSGKSRLLPTDALVPLRCNADVVQMRAEELDLSRWRMYLSSVRESEHIIESSMQKILEDDLVAARQRDRNIGPDTFHRWLTMARLLSLSFGEKTLTLERWGMVKELESSRAIRLQP